MKTTLINALLPGSGKTTLLTKLFKAYTPKASEHCIYLAKTNKALDNAKSMIGGEMLSANKSFKTIDQFRQNWHILTIDGVNHFVHESTKKQISRCYYTLFIDEISMVSALDIKEITDNFIISNIIAVGDASQHTPIAQSFIDKSPDGETIHTDDGSMIPASFWNNVYTLTESKRFNDKKFIDFLNVLKRKDIITPNFLTENLQFASSYSTSEYDMNICYTNECVRNVNYSYEQKNKVTRWLPIKKFMDKDYDINYQNGQFIGPEGYDVIKTVDSNFVEKYVTPAMAVTSHKIQGWTADNATNINIHAGDFENEKISDASYMRGLWVALTRARSLSQIKIIGITAEHLANKINSAITSDWTDKNIGVSITVEQLYDTILDMLNADNFDYTTDERYADWVTNVYSKAHSVQHKQHKQHKQIALTEEQIKDAKIIGARAWCRKYNLSNTTYYRAKKGE